MLRLQAPKTETLRSAKLVQPGYAGLLSLREARDIAAQIARNARVREAWGFPEQQRSYSLAIIAERAYPEDQKAARAHIQSQMVDERGKAEARAGRGLPVPGVTKKEHAPKATPAKARKKAPVAVDRLQTPASVTPRRAAVARTKQESAPARPTKLPRRPAAPRRMATHRTRS